MSTKPKIAVINNWLISGGAEKQGILLAKTLNEYFDVWYFIYYPQKIETKFMDIINNNNIKLILLNGNHIKKFLTFYKFCKKEKISIIFSYLFAGNFLNSIVGSILRTEHRIGGIRNSNESGMKNLVQRFLHNHLLTLSISNNHCGKNVFEKKGYVAKKIIVIPNCFEFKDDLYKRNSSKILNIITIARFVEQKDYLTAIKAIHHLTYNTKIKNINYTILGFGKLESEIKGWVEEYGIKDYVKIVISPDNVYKYLANSDIYLSTSIFEGLSNSIMEALSFKLPIVTTNVGDNTELVRHEHNGYLVDVGDYLNIANYIQKIIEDEEKRILFGENAYKHLKENYSMEKFKENYFTLINNLYV